MRYGVLADVHGNLHALQAAVAALRGQGVDRWLVAGDLVGYGPHPNECVELVAGLGAACVAGNHDLMALDLLSDERCITLARTSLRWTREVLRDDVRAFLGTLPLATAAPGGVVMAHGSLDDPECYTPGPAEAERELRKLAGSRPDARILVLGHTHRPLAVGDDGRARGVRRPVALGAGRLLLNPGAVGQSRELRARARCLVLDLEGGSAAFLAVGYDVAACRDSLRRAGLSPRSHHLRPTARGALRRVRRVARRGNR